MELVHISPFCSLSKLGPEEHLKFLSVESKSIIEGRKFESSQEAPGAPPCQKIRALFQPKVRVRDVLCGAYVVVSSY